MVTDKQVEAALRQMFAGNAFLDSPHLLKLSAAERMRAALIAAEAAAWEPIESAPKDETVLVLVEPTEQNKSFAGWPPQTFPAYINEDGRVFDCGTWLPDGGLDGEYWKSTHWRHLPQPPKETT